MRIVGIEKAPADHWRRNASNTVLVDKNAHSVYVGNLVSVSRTSIIALEYESGFFTYR